MSFLNKHKLKAFLVALPVIVALGAQLGTLVTPIILFASFVFITIFAAYGKISPHEYPFIIYSLALSFMWQASMVGVHVVGSDMHQEFYVSNEAFKNGWSITTDYGTQSSTSFVVGWLVPFLSRITTIDMGWVYKIILPAVYSFTPVILYQAFKKQINPRSAFYSCLFFMIVPVASLEIVQIGKSMVAEVFFALLILTMVSQMGWLRKTIIMVLCISIATLAHYTVGLIAISYLAIIFIVRIFTPLAKSLSLFRYNRTSVASLLVVLLLGCSITYSYYTVADGGEIMRVVKSIIPSYAKVTASTISNGINATVPPSVNKPIDGGNVEPTESPLEYLNNQSPLVKAVIGLDWQDASAAGRVFRVIQYITQFALLSGGILLLLKARKYGFVSEFVAGIGASGIVVAACILVPHFSTIINATRFYHMVLFFIAPLFVIGLSMFKKRWIVPAVIIVYFVFTSGLVFEVTKSEPTRILDVPYSIGMSAERTGIVGVYGEDDINCAKWLSDNAAAGYRIVGDYNGYRLMMGFVRQNPQLRTQDELYNPALDSLPDKCYVLITSWDTRNRKYVTDIRDEWESIGLRNIKPLPVFNYPIVYQSGDAKIYIKG